MSTPTLITKEEDEKSKTSTSSLELNQNEKVNHHNNDINNKLKDHEQQIFDQIEGEEEDDEHQISDRQLSWKSTAALLLTEYVVLAILAFPSSYAILGMAGGILTTLLIGLATLYTSHVLWRFCMAHRSVRDVCDVAYVLTGKKFFWWVTFVGLASNNFAIMGLHSIAGATAIQTIRQGTECTLVWAVVITAIMFAGSLIRDFKHMSYIGLFASSTMFLCTLIVLFGHGLQGTPNGYVPGVPVTISIWAPEGTTFVDAMNAVLNITYTWVGQALIPSFVGDMKHPEDFPKALYVSMIAEFILFTITGIVVYSFAGTEYTVAPGYGSLIEKYGKIAAGLVLPTIIIVGILYSIVTSRAIFFQCFSEGSVHRRKHTVKGWSVWFVIVFIGWIISFCIGEAVPFFFDLLALISSVFDSWFGFIFWGAAWMQLNKGKRFANKSQTIQFVMNVIMIIVGIFLFGAGTYTSVQSILNSYATGPLKRPFSCVNSGFEFTR